MRSVRIRTTSHRACSEVQGFTLCLLTDTAEAIGWLLQATGGTYNRELIRLYRELEREARSVVKERWGEVVEIAHLLLKYGLLTPKQRRWPYYQEKPMPV